MFRCRGAGKVNVPWVGDPKPYVLAGKMKDQNQSPKGRKGRGRPREQDDENDLEKVIGSRGQLLENDKRRANNEERTLQTG